jgi:PAS domain S-box-containing protein
MEHKTLNILRKIGSLVDEISTGPYNNAVDRNYFDNMLENIRHDLSDIESYSKSQHAQTNEKENIINKYQYLFDITKTGYFILDTNLCITEVNNAGLQQLGVLENQAIGHKLNHFIAPEYLESFYFFTRKILNNQSKEKCELCLKKSSKEQLWVIIEGVILTEENDGSFKILLTCVDITERKTAEENLKEKQALLESLLTNIPIVFWANDLKGNIIIQSKESVKSWGNLLGKAPEFSSMKKHTLLKWKDNSKRAIAGEIVKEELTYSNPEGEEKSVYNIMAPIYIDDQVHGAIGMNIDVTEKLKADKTIIEKEKLYRTLAENITGIPYRLSLETGNMVFFNNMVTELTGYKPNEFIKGDICGIDPIIVLEDRQRVMDIVSESVKQNSPFIVEYKIKHKNGSIRNFIEHGKPITSNQEVKPKFIDGVIFDVTERQQVQDALNNVTEHYLTLAETVPVGIYRTEKNGDCYFVNERWSSITDLSSDEAIGFQWINAVHNDDKNNVISKWTEIAGKKKSFIIEHRFVKKDKSVVWVINHAHAEVDSKGIIKGYVGTLTDITERKLSEELVHRYIDYLQFLSDFSLKINTITNIDELYDYVGKSVNKLLSNCYLFVSRYDENTDSSAIFNHYGFEKYLKRILDITKFDITKFSIKIKDVSEEEMKLFTSSVLSEVENGIFSLASRKIPSAICRTIESLLEVKKVFTIGFTKSNKLYGGINILSRSNEEPENKKLIENIVSQASIVMQRLITENKLQQSRNDLIKAQKIGKVGSFNIDIISKSFKVSDELYNIFGIKKPNSSNPLPLEYLVNDILIKYSHPEDAKLCKNHIIAVMDNGRNSIFDYRIVKETAEVQYLELTTNGEFDASNRLIEINGLIRDVSEQKKAQISLNELNHQLAEKNNELEQLVFISSHDLRAPLVNIQGFTDELKSAYKNLQSIIQTEKDPHELNRKVSQLINEEIAESLGFIISSSSKMDSLISGLLKVSRMGKTEIYRRELDMNKLINRIISNFEYSIKDYDIDVEVEKLPPCFADEALIDQVFSNIIDNAIKYRAPNRSCKISISGIGNPDNSVYIIRDNGKGIPEKFLDKVFAIFQRADNDCHGEGLGLAIVKRIIEKHNGKIWLDSKLGVGTKIYFSLPKTFRN